MAKKRKRVGARPVPLDIVGDKKGARILFRGTVFEARSVGSFSVEVEATGVGVRRWMTMDLAALRDHLRRGAELWLQGTLRVIDLGKGPTGEDFAQAWDRHRRLWSAANAN